MFNRYARNIKVENAISGIDEMIDEIMEIKIDFQDSQSLAYSEIQNINVFQQNAIGIPQALKAISEAEKHLNIAKQIFLKQKSHTASAMSDNQEEIIAILGGRQNMASLIGEARILPSGGDKGIIFAIPYVKGQGVTHIKIVLNDKGNYDVTFFAPMTGTTPKIKKALKSVSSDTLLSVIKTYAYLSF